MSTLSPVPDHTAALSGEQLAVRAPVTRFSPSDTALVIVDAQNDFCHPQGTMARRGKDLSAVERAVHQVTRCIDAARASDVPVVFVKTVHGDQVDSIAWTHRYAGGTGPGHQPAPANCLDGSWGAEFYRVRPLPHEMVTVKHRYSAFSTPGFRGRLEALGRGSLLFAGFTTGVCVESSLRAAVDNDFLGSVVSDACAEYSTTEHASAVEAITAHFGGAIATDELIRRWDQNREEVTSDA